jgi:hypothetical protein
MGAKVTQLQAMTLEAAIRAIHIEFEKALQADHAGGRARLATGKMLVALRKRIEAGEAGEGVNWWRWYASKFVRSRKDAEKVMRIAQKEDPELAAEKERAEARERMARSREAAATDPCEPVEDGAHVRGRSNSQPDRHPAEEGETLVDHALRLVALMNATQLTKFFAALKEGYDHETFE